MEARAELESLPPAGLALDERVTRQALLASVLVRLGEATRAAEIFANAEGQEASAHPDVRAELAYVKGFAAWWRGDVEAAEELVEQALRDATDIVQGRSLELLGWIEVRRERYAVAARHFLSGLESLQRAAHRDELVRANLLQGASVIALETLDFGLYRRLLDHQRDMSWPASAGRQRFFTLQNFALVSLLEDDAAGAWHRLHTAAEAAMSDAQRSTVQTDLAFLSRLVGDEFAAARYLESAHETLGRVRWSDCDDEDRTALLEFAREAARTNVSAASEALTRYFSLRKRTNKVLSLEGDRRMEAFERHADGVVALCRKDVSAAIPELRAAYDTWRDIGYRMRETAAALDLYDATQDEQWLGAADRASRNAPRSWLAKAIGAHRAQMQSPEARLTPAERIVLTELRAGKTNNEIARSLGKSPFTINNHTKKIFKAFGVNTRASLIAKTSGSLSTENGGAMRRAPRRRRARS